MEIAKEDMANCIAGASLAVSIVGFFFAYITLKKSNENSSASFSLTMADLCRQAWARYLDAATDDQRAYAFGDMMNVFENGATLFNQGAFSGITKDMQEKYLKDVFQLLSDDPGKRRAVRELADENGTFKHAKKFCAARNIKLFHH